MTSINTNMKIVNEWHTNQPITNINEWHTNQPITYINDKCDYMFNTLTFYNYKEKRFHFYIDYQLR